MNILMTIFVISATLGMLMGTLMLIGSSIYDVAALQEKNRPARISKNARRKYRPKVSMILPAFNEAAVIARSLDNLGKQRYKDVEIIVADDKSTDNTREIVRAYIKAHPDRNLRLVCKRKNGGRGSAINAGLRHATGEIVVAYDPDCAIGPYALYRLVAHFADPAISAVAANVRINHNGTTLSLLQQLEYLVSFRSKKFNTLTNSEIIIGGAGASYRRTVLNQVGGFDDRMKTEDIELSMRMTRKLGRTGGLKYASDYLVYTEAVPTYRALFRQRFRWKFGSLQALFFNRQLFFSFDRKQNVFLTWLRLPLVLWAEIMLLLEPIYFCVFLYLAVSANNPALFISASGAYTVITWLAIWSDEHFKRQERIKLSLITPFMYTASFVMSVVQVSAAIRCLANIRGITGLKAISGAYTTTQRAITQELPV